MSVEELEAEAKQLTERDRFELGQRLLSESVPLSDEQRAELKSRIQEVRDGTAEIIGGDVVDAEIDALINEAG